MLDVTRDTIRSLVEDKLFADQGNTFKQVAIDARARALGWMF